MGRRRHNHRRSSKHQSRQEQVNLNTPSVGDVVIRTHHTGIYRAAALVIESPSYSWGTSYFVQTNMGFAAIDYTGIPHCWYTDELTEKEVCEYEYMSTNT